MPAGGILDGQLLTPWRLKTYPRALLACLLAAVAISVVTSSGSSTVTGRLGGDLPAFYGAGRVVVEGQAHALYDWTVQAASQEGLHAGAEDEFLAFAYPPFLAVAYAPLALLPFVLAYVVHTLGMLGALAGSIALMRSLLPRVDRWPIEAFSLAFAFYPLFRAITGAQNTALTLLLLTGVWWALARDRPMLAGALGGLLLFKPQFALPALGLVVLRHPRAALGATASAVGLWGVAAVVSGPGWIGAWVAQAGTFHEVDQAVNAPNSVGIVGFCEAVLGPGTPAAIGLGGALTLALIGGLVALWWRRDAPLDLRMAALTCGVLLVPPHSMFYDAGLLVLPFAVLADRHGRASFGGLTALVVVGTAAVGARTLGANPLFVVAVATLVWVVATWRSNASRA